MRKWKFKSGRNRRNWINYFFLYSALLFLASCVVRPGAENGDPPTFTFTVRERGGPTLTISSTQACPPDDSLTNNFDTVFLSLPANHTYFFIYSATDRGGVQLADFITNDSTVINFEVLAPDNTILSTLPPTLSKEARLWGGTTPRTSLLMTGNLLTQADSGRTGLVFQAFDRSGNDVFHTLTVNIEPENSVSEVIFEGECR